MVNVGRGRTNQLKTRLILILICVLVGAFAGVHMAEQTSKAPSSWMLITCDVGQGNAALLRTGEHSAVLIDTGDSISSLKSCASWAEVLYLDAILLTHSHADHTAALEDLPPDFQAQIFVSENNSSPPHKAQPLPAGSSMRWEGNKCAIDVTVLGPQKKKVHSNAGGESAAENNNSLVTYQKFTCGQQQLSYLSTGDIEEEAVTELARSYGSAFPRTDVVAVPHHGSKGSGVGIYKLSQPRLALISAGRDNEYGHPHAEITDYLQDSGIYTEQTRLNGHIAISVQEDALTVTRSK